MCVNMQMIFYSSCIISLHLIFSTFTYVCLYTYLCTVLMYYTYVRTYICVIMYPAFLCLLHFLSTCMYLGISLLLCCVVCVFQFDFYFICVCTASTVACSVCAEISSHNFGMFQIIPEYTMCTYHSQHIHTLCVCM